MDDISKLACYDCGNTDASVRWIGTIGQARCTLCTEIGRIRGEIQRLEAADFMTTHERREVANLRDRLYAIDVQRDD